MRAIFVASVFIIGAACSISTLQNLLKLKADSERVMNVMNSTLDYMMRIGKGFKTSTFSKVLILMATD